MQGPLGTTSRQSKKGMASTPCFLNGRVFVRGKDGLYAVDAETGALLWHRRTCDAGTMPLGIGSAPAEGSVLLLVKMMKHSSF